MACGGSGLGFRPDDTNAATALFKDLFTFKPGELQGGGGVGGGTGSGLGMALARSIVAAHGGQMWVTSDGVGKGIRLGFSIPLSADGARAAGDTGLGFGSAKRRREWQMSQVMFAPGAGPGPGAASPARTPRRDAPVKTAPRDATATAAAAAVSPLFAQDQLKGDEARAPATAAAPAAQLSHAQKSPPLQVAADTGPTAAAAAAVAAAPPGDGDVPVVAVPVPVPVPVSVPVPVPAETKAAPVDEPPAAAVAAGTGARKLRVLIVEDSAICRTMLKKFLATLEVRVSQRVLVAVCVFVLHIPSPSHPRRPHLHYVRSARWTWRRQRTGKKGWRP